MSDRRPLRIAAVASLVIAVAAACAGGPLTSGPLAATTVVPAGSTPVASPQPEPTDPPSPLLKTTPLPNNLAAAPCLATPTGGPYLRSDGRSLTCQGRPVELTGYTFYPALLGGAKAWRAPGFSSYIDHILDLGAAAGQNLIRATDQWDPNTKGQVYDDSAIWSNMDYLVAAARKRGVFVVIDLSAYRWLLISQGADPNRPGAWTAFIEFVAARYRDASNVAFYSIAGEPTPPKDPAGLDGLVTFYSLTTQTLRAADPNHLITIGGLNHMEDSPQLGWWQEIDNLPTNDIVAVKTYSQHDLDLMPTIAAYARAVHRPVLEDEFGMPQGYGDGSFAGGSAYNGLSTGRGPFFGSVYRSGESLGYAAFIFWNMGCQIGATSYEVSPRTPSVWSVVVAHGAVPPETQPSLAGACS